jgi:molybdopterin-guanine dinucleotide biosynthesis protein A
MTQPLPITATILAGGLSRRMFATAHAGAAISDKGLLTLGPTSMIAHVIAIVRPQVTGLVLNANGDPVRFAGLGLPVVADPVEGFVGPLAGVLAGLQWTRRAHPSARYTLSVSSDAPFLPADLALRLSAALADREDAIALARSGGELHPVIGLWPVALAEDLEAALRAGVRKVLRWTDRHGTVAVDFPFFARGGRDVDPFFNANTPEELDEARRLLAEAGP